MNTPILLDLSHTSHTHARTGIQRVARSLHAALGEVALPITHDPHARLWRRLEAWERATLARQVPGRKRGAQWPLAARLRGRVRRWKTHAPLDPRLASRARDAAGLVVPEIFSRAVALALPELFAATRGPRVAIFHDAIALQFPELTPPKNVARFPAYLVELLAFDGIAAISEASRDALLEYWRWLGRRDTPPVATIPLGLELPPEFHVSPESVSGTPPEVLCVGSIEGRKNHLALLEACEQLWARGETFPLRLIGLAQPQTGAAALARIRALQAAGRPLRYDGPASDVALEAAYAVCAFTVYPSLVEGFGLPVLESLARGKPCICSARGALGESARDGGCVALEKVDAAALAPAIARLLNSAEERRRLAAAARRRSFRPWSEYAQELVGWMRTLSRRG